MTEQTPVSIDDVRALVAERHRFDDWLSALEGRRADTPEHVYARVHGDYLARRQRVLEQLHAQAPALADLLATLDATSSELAARMGAQEDERTEAMLRHAVGEFDDAAWHAVRDRVEASLQEMGVEHTSLESQRADVRQLLAEAMPEVAPESEPEPELEADASAPAAEHVGASTPSIDEAAAQAPEAATEPFDGPSWMTDDAVAAPTEEPAISADDAPDRVLSITETLAAIEADVVDEPITSREQDENGVIRPPMSGGLERPNFWGTRQSGVPAAEPADTEPQDLYGDATSDRGVASDSGGAAAPADAFDELAFLRSVIDPQAQSPSVPKAPGTDAPQKTLRCTECGTMNLPTEWYCERCGGELATF
jgi:hypothetical protein